MQPTLEYVRAALALQGIPVPEDEIENVHKRLTLWFSALDKMEAEIGVRMDEAEPIPPVFPHENE